VLAGPGAGKTFCLIERIRYLIDHLGIDPSRICAFTFTNKAAEEITSRLEQQLGPRAAGVKSGTIHAFCAELLREFGTAVGLNSGFGIADEQYQLTVLRRIEGYRKWHGKVLRRFCMHRFRGEELEHRDRELFDRYERYLAGKNVVDFDSLVLMAAELLENARVAPTIRRRWDVVLVDEFQDLNPVQYRVVRELARDHRHVFAVGDDEQSIYSWTGSDIKKVFPDFMNDFGISTPVHIQENRRCPRDVFELARKLVEMNSSPFDNRMPAPTSRESGFPVIALTFATDEIEAAWIIDDVRRDQLTHPHEWGDVALLYRKHSIGVGLETAFLNAGIPCQLAQGRALAEEPVVAYLLAALRVIVRPDDDVFRDAFFATILPRTLFDRARAEGELQRRDLLQQFYHMEAQLSRNDAEGRRVRRALYVWRNLDAIGRRHTALAPLVQDLLSHAVGKHRSALEERHDELTDPAGNPEVVRLADRLRRARERGDPVTLNVPGGIDIPLKGMLDATGVRTTALGESPAAAGERIGVDDVPSLGTALGLFKALQLLESRDLATSFRDYTTVDLETTGRDTAHAEIVEIAAVRVRDGRVVDQFSSLVKPSGPIPSGATRVHKISDADVAGAPQFEEVWPAFRAFCGDDLVVAHNGYDFDFPIMERMLGEAGLPWDLHPYDTLPLARELFPTSRKLTDLAREFGVDPGESHRALDDARTLAPIFLRLDEAKSVRARKASLANLLGHLGIALALSDLSGLDDEVRIFQTIARPFALGRYSGALEFYESEATDREDVPSADEVIELLGGAKLMERIRAERSADDRYPTVMPRLRRILEKIPDATLHTEIALFLERVVLSKSDGPTLTRNRVNLLTLHSTKGLEFSRVYVVGAEDGQLPGNKPNSAPEPEEVEEGRRLLYVGMTRTCDRLVLTRVEERDAKPTGGHRFLDEMGLIPRSPS